MMTAAFVSSKIQASKGRAANGRLYGRLIVGDMILAPTQNERTGENFVRISLLQAPVPEAPVPGRGR